MCKVSVCVVTFNSSLTVIETLNSILEQTFDLSLIELIISDDASTDNTVAVVESWIEKYKDDFYNVKFNKHVTNQGVTRNFNSAWRLAQGTWIKSIAGDDVLLPSCIHDNLEYIHQHQIESILFSSMQAFCVNNSNIVNLAIYPSAYQKKILNSPTKKQLRYLLDAGGFACAPSSFISRKMLHTLGYGDERFKMIEDLPLWIKTIDSGYKLYFMDKVTVMYRIGNSVSQTSSNLLSISHIEQKLLIDLLIAKNRCSLSVNFRKSLYYSLLIALIFISKNKKNIITITVYRMALLLKPRWLKERLHRNKK